MREKNRRIFKNKIDGRLLCFQKRDQEKMNFCKHWLCREKLPCECLQKIDAFIVTLITTVEKSDEWTCVEYDATHA